LACISRFTSVALKSRYPPVPLPGSLSRGSLSLERLGDDVLLELVSTFLGGVDVAALAACSRFLCALLVLAPPAAAVWHYMLSRDFGPPNGPGLGLLQRLTHGQVLR
jgi:hypothetical protein